MIDTGREIGATEKHNWWSTDPTSESAICKEEERIKRERKLKGSMEVFSMFSLFNRQLRNIWKSRRGETIQEQRKYKANQKSKA